MNLINDAQTMSDAILVFSLIIFVAFLCMTFALISISISLRRISDSIDENRSPEPIKNTNTDDSSE